MIILKLKRIETLMEVIRWTFSNFFRAIHFGALFLFLGLLPPLYSSAQDSVLLTKNFQFKNGIYLNINELQSNQPSYLWEEVQANLFINPQTFLAQVAHVVSKENPQDTLPLNHIWAISIEGVPYVRLPKGLVKRSLPTFAALKVRGKICYFSYPDSRIRHIPMAAYNPLNGKPFRQAVVQREEEFLMEKMMLFETGEIQDFNILNFLNWIQNDERLTSTVQNLDSTEIQEKLFKCLLIYDDRNEVFIVSTAEN